MTNYISPLLMSAHHTESLVQFCAKFFGSHKALERSGVPGSAFAASSNVQPKKKKPLITNASSELLDDSIAFACDLIRIQLSPSGEIFLDVNRADGRIACNHSDNDTIARFDTKTLPSTNEVSLQSVAHWTHWGEYVPPYSVVK